MLRLFQNVSKLTLEHWSQLGTMYVRTHLMRLFYSSTTHILLQETSNWFSCTVDLKTFCLSLSRNISLTVSLTVSLTSSLSLSLPLCLSHCLSLSLSLLKDHNERQPPLVGSSLSNAWVNAATISLPVCWQIDGTRIRETCRCCSRWEMNVRGRKWFWSTTG